MIEKFLTSESVEAIAKWIMNHGLAIAILLVIFYYNREDIIELRVNVKELEQEMKLYLRQDRDTLIKQLDKNNKFLERNGKK